MLQNGLGRHGNTRRVTRRLGLNTLLAVRGLVWSYTDLSRHWQRSGSDVGRNRN